MDLLDDNIYKNGDQEIIEDYWNKNLGAPLSLLPESLAAYLWRCACDSKTRPIQQYNFTTVCEVVFLHCYKS